MKKGDIVLNKFGSLKENRILCYIGNRTLYIDKYGDVYASNYIPKWL